MIEWLKEYWGVVAILGLLTTTVMAGVIRVLS